MEMEKTLVSLQWLRLFNYRNTFGHLHQAHQRKLIYSRSGLLTYFDFY